MRPSKGEVTFQDIQHEGQRRCLAMKRFEVILRAGGASRVIADGCERRGELIMFFRGPSHGCVATFSAAMVSDVRELSAEIVGHPPEDEPVEEKADVGPSAV